MRILCSLFLITMLASACSSIKIYSENNNETALDQYETYAFVEVPLDQIDQATAILYEELRKRIATEMEDRAFVPDTENPDLYIAFNMLTEVHRKEVTKSANPYSPYGMSGLWSSPYSYRGAYDYRYKEIQINHTGTLVVDIISSDLKEPVWRGVGLGPTNDPEERFETAYKIVKKLFNKFPN